MCIRDRVEEADAITNDMDARYAAYAKAEAYMLDHVLVLPCDYEIGWALSKIDNDSKMDGMFGIQNNKMKNWDCLLYTSCVNNSVIIWGFQTNHFTELGAFACTESISFFFAQGLDVYKRQPLLPECPHRKDGGGRAAQAGLYRQ